MGNQFSNLEDAVQSLKLLPNLKTL